jgi:phosphotransferase system enzyme I (PtsI)
VNERIAHLYEPTHPAILKLIKNTIDISHEYGIWTGVCGEMAGNPLMTPLLVGLGIDELSVSPPATPAVKDVVRKMTYSRAERLAALALAAENGDAVMSLCREAVGEIAPEILALID